MVALYRHQMQGYCKRLEREEANSSRPMPFAKIPPASLRFRVASTPELDDFLKVGEQCLNDIEAALCKVGTSLEELPTILDFGCGCGRTLLWLAQRAKTAQLFGTDVDSTAIAWCEQNLDLARFNVNAHLPPINYDSDTFDLLYGISVFTHLNEDYQFQWLKELQRILKSGGVAIFSVHGDYAAQSLLPNQLEQLGSTGFLFAKAESKKGICPDWYQTAFHTEKYIRSRWAQYFQILEYIPRGMNNHHDLVVLRKKV